MAISFVNKGTFQSGTGTVAPGIPASMAAGDLMILVIHSVNQSITGPTGWTALTFPSHSGTAERGTAAAAGGVMVRCFARWWQSGDAAPTVADTGDMTAAIILGFRGVDPTTPFDGVTPVGMNAAAATTHTLTGVTTASANALVVHATALDNDAASTSVLGAPTNANLSSLTEQHDQTVTAGQGGGINVITGFLASAGASGNTTTATGTSTAIASICFCLRPEVDYTAAGWTHRAPIVIQESVITGSSNLTDMPVLLTQDCIPADFLDSDLFQSDGGDIRFSSDSTGATMLPVEIVTFSGHSTPASATAEIWVRVPTVSYNSDTTIYMWRKSGAGLSQVAVGNTNGRNAVWTGNGIKRVYHGNGTTESAGIGSALTASGNATYTTTNAKIGSAFTLDGTGDYLTGDSNADIDNLTPMSVAFWARTSARKTSVSDDQIIVSKGDYNGWSVSDYAVDASPGRVFLLRADDAEYSAANKIQNNTWFQGVMTSTSNTLSSMNYYHNGAAETMTLYQEEGSAVSDASNSFRIGADSADASGAWIGLIDEVWLANVAWSADFIQAIYANQNSPGAFAIEGSVVSLGGHDLTATGIATGAPSVGAPAITQAHALTATGIAAGAPSVGAPGIAQVHILTATAVDAGSPSLGAPAATEITALPNATAIATGAPSVGTPDLAQVHALTATTLLAGAPSLATPALTQEHALAATAIAAGAPSTGAPALTQVQALTADGIATATPAVDAPAIGQAHVLTTSTVDAGAPALDEPVLSQAGELVADAVAAGAPALGSPAIAQTHTLTATALSGGTPSLGTPALAESHALAGQGIATGAPSTGGPSLGQAHALTAPALASGAPALGSPALHQAHALIANGLAAGQATLASPELWQAHALEATAVTFGQPALGAPSVAQVHALTGVAIALGGPALDAPALSQAQAFAAIGIDLGAPVLGTPALLVDDGVEPINTLRVATLTLPARIAAAALAGRVAAVEAQDRTIAVEGWARMASVERESRAVTIEQGERSA